MSELVSVIMPVYNGARYLPEAIESVLGQTYPHWELIVVDDGSEDESRTIVEAYARRDGRIRLLALESNRGAAAARNVGLAWTRGGLIAFLDSDDAWMENKLQQQIAHMSKQKSVFSYTYYIVLDENGHYVDQFCGPMEIKYTDLLKTNYISTSSVIIHKSILKMLCFKEKLIRHEDLAMWLDVLKLAKVCHAVPEPLVTRRLRKGSMSANKIHNAYWQWYIYRNVEKLPLMVSLYYLVNWSVWGFVKHSRFHIKKWIRNNRPYRSSLWYLPQIGTEKDTLEDSGFGRSSLTPTTADSRPRSPTAF